MKNSHTSHVKNLTQIALAAALITVCAWITVPAAVSFTMQTFAVFAAAGLLGTRRGTLAVAIYIALGALGLPVFSGFRGGIGVLAGNTGGYIVGFVFASLICGLLISRFGHTVPALFLSMLAGLIVCYAFGSAWYYFLYTQNTGNIGILWILTQCVFPFIPFDLAKIALAAFLVRRLRRIGGRWIL